MRDIPFPLAKDVTMNIEITLSILQDTTQAKFQQLPQLAQQRAIALMNAQTVISNISVIT